MAAPKKPNAAAKAKLKRFLKQGDPQDIASVLVQTLMHRAEVAAQVQKDLAEAESKTKDEE